jgi:hypothetical protein
LVDNDLLLAKASTVKRHLRRVEEKCKVDLKTFLADIDRQEIIMFNLQMAIQNCVDIAAHIIRSGFKTPSEAQWLRCRPPINAHIPTYAALSRSACALPLNLI